MNKLINKEKTIVSIGIVLFFSVFQKGISFFREIIFARTLGPSDYGIFILAIFFIQLIGGFAVLGIPSCYSRYITQYEKRGLLKEFFKRTFSFTLLVGCGIVALCLLFSEQIAISFLGSKNLNSVILVSSCVILPLMFYKHIIASYNGLRIFKISSLMESLHVLVYTIIGIGFLMYANVPDSAILANFISFVGVTCLFGAILVKYVSGQEDENSNVLEDDFDKKIFRFSIWFMITPVVFMIFNYIDRLMLNRYLGLYDVGIYSVASNITQMVFIIGMIIGNVLMPNLSQEWEKEEKAKVVSRINISLKITMLFLCSLAVAIAYFKTDLISILYGKEYTQGLNVVAPLLIFWLFNSMVWIVGVYPQLIEKTHLTLFAYLPGLVLNVFLNVLFIPSFGMIGAAFATVLSFTLILLMALVLYIREELRVEKETLFAFFMPSILLCHESTMVIMMLLIIILTGTTNLYLKREEKLLFMNQLKGIKS